jgi:Flp pilus assembly protein TadB
MNIQLETFDALLNKQTGLVKTVTKKIINSDFVEALNKILINTGVGDINDAVKKLIDKAVREVTNSVRRKIATIFTIIFCILGTIITLVTLAAGGNVIIPLVIFAIIIVIIWLVTGNIFKRIANKITDKIFTTVKQSIPMDNKEA